MLIPTRVPLKAYGLAFLSLAVLLSSGCLGRVSEQTREYQLPDAGLESVVVRSPDQPNVFAVSEPRLEGAQLTVSLHKQITEQPYTFQRVIHLRRWVRSPAYLPLLLPIPGWFVCMAPSVSCMGQKGDWETVQIEERDKQPSGPAVERWVPWEHGVPDASLAGLDQNGAVVEQAPATVSAVRNTPSRYAVALKSDIEALSARPYQASITLAYGKNTARPVHTEVIGIPHNLVSSLNPHSDRWLPLQEQRDIYYAGLDEALSRGRHGEAVAYYEKIESLPYALPDGFYYRYAYSLRQAGQVAQSKVLAKRYISQAGKDGEFYLQALKLL